MQRPKLNDLALLYIDTKNFEKLLKNPTPVLEVFGKIRNRILQF
jgi:hypothetical protein